LTPEERARWRQQARDWLRADLARLDKLSKSPEARPRQEAEKALQHWLRDPDFTQVRAGEALARLPQSERQAWQALWADVQQTLLRAQTKAAPAKK
jgi:eukaryotic-like serine/threonine-protein kinase